MKVTTILLFIGVMLMSGCARSIADIDVSHADKGCVRQCTMAYSSSVSLPFANTIAMNRAADSYEICVKTCTTDK